MNLKNIAAARARSRELEILASGLSAEEFYNRCHDENGRFCEGEDGPGRVRDNKKSFKGRFSAGAGDFDHVETQQDALDAIPEEGREALDYVFHAVDAIEPGYTEGLEEIAERHGGRLAGKEFRKKSPKSIVSRIHRNMRDGDSAEDAVNALGDTLRYTVELDEDAYEAGFKETVLALDDAGARFKDINNSWGFGGQYAGMNTTVVDPTTGLNLEIQFHTPDSFKVKSDLHEDYETMRELSGSREDLFKTWSRMSTASDGVSRPIGWDSLYGDTGLTDVNGDPLIMEDKVWGWEKTSKKLDRQGR